LDRQAIPYVVATRSEVDLLDRDATRALFEKYRPDTVLHTAARVHGLMGNQRFPAEMFDDNLAINFNVITAGRAVGVKKFTVASTVAAYPGDLVTDIHEDQYLAGKPHAGESAYAHAKRAMLAQLNAYKVQYGISYAYAILTNLYGPNDRFDIENGHIIPSLIAKFHTARREGTPVKVWGTGRARRDFMFIDDAADAMLRLAEVAEGPVNVATGITLPIARVVEILSGLSGVTDIIWESDKPEGQLDRSYDVSRLRAAGYEARFTLEEGLKQTWDWYAAHWPDLRS